MPKIVYNESTKKIDSLNRSLSDNVSLFVRYDGVFSEGEIEKLAQLGITVYNESWIPPMLPDFPYSLYSINCKLGDICRLIEMDRVKMISDGEREVSPLNVQ